MDYANVGSEVYKTRHPDDCKVAARYWTGGFWGRLFGGYLFGRLVTSGWRWM